MGAPHHRPSSRARTLAFPDLACAGEILPIVNAKVTDVTYEKITDAMRAHSGTLPRTRLPRAGTALSPSTRQPFRGQLRQHLSPHPVVSLCCLAFTVYKQLRQARTDKKWYGKRNMPDDEDDKKGKKK